MRLAADMMLKADTTTIIVIIAVVLFFALAGALFLAYIGYCRKLYARIFRRRKPVPKVDRSPSSIEQETIFGRGMNWFYSNRNEYLNVRIDSFDKTKLSGYYRPSSDRECRSAVILLHGYDEHPAQMAAYAKLMMRQIQCHVLITHMRAHRMSGGKYCTFGLYESVDLMRWIEFIKRQAGADIRIFIVGRSMGAVTALLASQQQDFPENVAGIIADCPYESLDRVLRDISAKSHPHLNMTPFLHTVNRFVNKNLGFDMDRCDCVENVGRTKCPVLFFAGGRDDICGPDGVRHIYDNVRTPKRLVVVDHAEHLMCYDRATAVYEREVRKFIENCVVRLVSRGKM